ncbi:hypothetical protein EYF80_055465 [Liparis tanakae]|uniref:Uncharacterized protein n=1 Tax=Liparis tanakae TaxID=230148 RepID=A0A4Z2F093_9TELE|nr:hypothetical protein EYF80_055465 [Liparis tanakae]
MKPNSPSVPERLRTHWRGAASGSPLSTVRMMTICSRLWAGDAGGRSCSTSACSVSELMVCSGSGSKVTGSSAPLMAVCVGSGLKSWMMASGGGGALGSGVAGSGASLLAELSR